MSEFSVLAALSLPSVATSPSVNCVQFSEDGQVVLLTKHAVYILTPDCGVNVELSSSTKQTTDLAPSSRGARPLGWLRTLVEFDRGLVHQWPADCQDGGSVCLGSLDPSLQALALSPSHLTSDAGCVLALLNSNSELTIWGASKNFLTGEMAMLHDVTSALKTAAGETESSALSRMLNAQATCIEWSPQPDWGLTPAPPIDASLLAVGSRAGSVTFLRFDRVAQQMVVAHSATVSDRWVRHLSWSAWTNCHDGTCQAMLACGAADGSVSVLNVYQTLALTPSHTKISSDHEISLSARRHDSLGYEADGRAITGMKWVNTRGGNPVLIVHKAGTLHLLSGESPQTGWSGCKTLTLRAQTRSVGSSALSPASGICYDPNLDATVLSLSDGSFHVVHGISVEPTLDSSPESVSSDALSAASRAIFLQTEQDKVTFQDVDQVNGMTTYDDRSTFMWIYEPSRPTDFSYKHDAKHVSTLVVAQMWQENRDERIIREIAERVGCSPSGFGGAPIGRLRSLLLHLRDPQIIARLHKRILDTLSHTPCSGPAPDFVIPSYIGDWDVNLSHDLVDSLAKHLFGWKSVQSVRVRYAVAAYCQSCSAAADVERQFAEAANQSVRDIRAHFLLVVLRHLSALRDVLNASDVYFARRTVLLATMPGTPSALAKEAGELLSQLLPTANTDPSGPGIKDSLDELCPACHASIPLQDADSAVCPNGHVWARCCVTSLLLATPSVRTCVGCTRKAFLHTGAPTPAHDDVGSSSGLPNSARGSRLLRDLLDATRRCPFCGNNFVALV